MNNSKIELNKGMSVKVRAKDFAAAVNSAVLPVVLLEYMHFLLKKLRMCHLEVKGRGKAFALVSNYC